MINFQKLPTCCIDINKEICLKQKPNIFDEKRQSYSCHKFKKKFCLHAVAMVTISKLDTYNILID